MEKRKKNHKTSFFSPQVKTVDTHTHTHTHTHTPNANRLRLFSRDSILVSFPVGCWIAARQVSCLSLFFSIIFLVFKFFFPVENEKRNAAFIEKNKKEYLIVSRCWAVRYSPSRLDFDFRFLLFQFSFPSVLILQNKGGGKCKRLTSV